MRHRPNFAIILLTCLILAACSGFGESARLKRQAKQFMEDGRLPEAVLTYRQALISYPDDPDLLSGLGLALAAQGRGRPAAGVLIQAAALKPGEASIKNALAKTGDPTPGWSGSYPGMDFHHSGLRTGRRSCCSRQDFRCICGWAPVGSGSGLRPGNLGHSSPGRAGFAPCGRCRAGLGGRREWLGLCIRRRVRPEPGQLSDRRSRLCCACPERAGCLLRLQRWNTVRSGPHDTEDQLESPDRRCIECQPRVERDRPCMSVRMMDGCMA